MTDEQKAKLCALDAESMEKLKGLVDSLGGTIAGVVTNAFMLGYDQGKLHGERLGKIEPAILSPKPRRQRRRRQRFTHDGHTVN